MNKYIITDEAITHDGVVLRRIRRNSDGAAGGFIESEKNLSQEGNCWIGGKAKVYGDAFVRDDALVEQRAAICGHAIIADNAVVTGEAVVSGCAVLTGEACVNDKARVSGRAVLCGKALVKENGQVNGDARLIGNATVRGHAKVGADCVLTDNIVVSGNMELFGNACLSDNVAVRNTMDMVKLGGTPVPVALWRHGWINIDGTPVRFDDWLYGDASDYAFANEAIVKVAAVREFIDSVVLSFIKYHKITVCDKEDYVPAAKRKTSAE